MIIDFHTHIFPDSIAQKTIEVLQNKANIKAHTDGTLAGLKSSMKHAGIDYSIVLPVATKPSQVESINTFASQINGIDGIYSFGGMHPLYENYRAELDRIVSLGLKGIKLHPDYQQFFVDDESIYPMLSYAKSIGLYIIFHAGVDIGIPGETRCTPKRARNMIDAIGGDKIILAHCGGYKYFDDVEKYLVGQNIYLDTSYILDEISDEQFVRIAKNHGTDRILFATDSPWGNPKTFVEKIKTYNFTQNELDEITHKNALSILE